MEGPENTHQDPQGNAFQVVTPQEDAGLQKISLEESTPSRGSASLLTKLRSKFSSKKAKIILAVFGILVLFLTFSFVGISLVSKEIMLTKSHAKDVLLAIESRDLEKARESLTRTGESLEKSEQAFRRTVALKYVPLVSWYWKDAERVFQAGQHGIDAARKVLDAIEPYADVLGFTGAKVDQVSESAEDRIIFIAETAQKLEPALDDITSSLLAANEQIAAIDEKHYPTKLFGVEIRQQVNKLKLVMSSTSESVSQFKPILGILPELLGNPEPKTYLLLFQNDAELRPTGGFMTAYATMTMDKGKINTTLSEDIYSLDAKFNKKVPAPPPIKKYLPLVYYWYLRDMNLSPDFKLSMDTFTSYYKQVPGAPEVDAIIAIDTAVPVRILEVLGPTNVPGYGGKFSADNDPRCDCPQVIYELENIITRPTYEIREGRKSILGPLMNSLLANMMGSPRSKWPEFFNIFTESIKEKHLMMYFFEEDKQRAVETLEAAGRIVDYSGDYLHINDTNFAGAKSNLFVEQEVIQEVVVEADGSLTKKLTLTYRNPAKASNCNLEAGQLCLNGILRDWIRVYVPLGSTLKTFKGIEVDPATSEDLGKTVFEGFFTLAPESVKKLEIEYTTPPLVSGDYRLLIQKQPGTKTIPHTILLGSKEEKLDLDQDIEVIIAR